MKKRIGSCLAMVIFIAVICLWVGTKEMEKQDNIVEGGSMGTIEEGRDEKHRDAWEEKRASDLETIDASEDIYDAFPNAVYEHIRSLYHDEYEDVNLLHHNRIEFVSNETYEAIRNVYKEINFYGEAERGDKESYGFYLEKFHLLLEEKVKFTLPERLRKPYTEKTQMYLSEYGEMKSDSKNGRLTPEDYLYYFFDMNGDDKPELCMREESDGRYLYIFQYKEETDEFILWQELLTVYERLIGTKKRGYAHYTTIDGEFYEYHELDEEGNERLEGLFYCLYKTETGEFVKVYMVGLPEPGKSENQKKREYIEEAPYKIRDSRLKLYRITKEQYEELTNDYFEVLEWRKENLKQVTYTYEELFHNEIEFVSDEKFEEINNAYKEIDFFGEFEQGNKEKEEYYQEKFHQLLKGEVKFTLSKEANEYYLRETQYSLNEYLGLKTYPGNEEELTFVPEDHLYYFYDINKDGIPELCINPKEGKRYYYIFQYIEERDEIILRHKRYKSYYPFMGTKKTTCHIPGTIKDYYQFYEQDEEGEKEVTFYKAYRMKQGEWEEEYMVEMPYDYEKEIKGNREEERLYGTRSSQSTYYRITKEQYEELTNPFFQALEKAEENLKQVTYTYEELFGKET